MKAGILHVSFHAGEGEGATDLPDCCARAPHVKVNKTNKTMGASVLGQAWNGAHSLTSAPSETRIILWIVLVHIHNRAR